MAHLKNKTIREFNEKDLQDRLSKLVLSFLSLMLNQKKAHYGKKVESLNHFEKILQEC